MKARRKIRTKQRDAGIALLISIFILLLISVVAIALIVSSSTETALAGNYRSSTGVYYAAVAGLEEARSRLVSSNPNSFRNTDPGFLPAAGTPLAVCSPYYVLNPLGAETVTPWDSSSTYADKEFGPEFASSSCSMPPSPPWVNSVWKRSPLNTLSFPGPLYKWVRINAVSEQSLNLDVFPYDGAKSSTTPVYYDGTRLNDTGSGAQVLELTALAVLPNGSQKLVQYLTAPTPLNLNFVAALTMDGNGVVFNTTTSPNYFVKGNDQYPAFSCTPGATPVTAIGYTSASASAFTQPSNPSGIPIALTANYTNYLALNPDIYPVTLSPNLTTVAGLNALVQTITQNADVPPITPPGQLTDVTNFMPAAMSATNPMTIVINGDLTINGWHHHGYGLLLVTGNLQYDPDAFWHGIILVIGKGDMRSNQGSGTGGHIEGAVFIAPTTDSSGIPLSSLGTPRYDFTSSALTPSGSNYYGVYYSSCWIQAAMPKIGYKILSFHEISQP